MKKPGRLDVSLTVVGVLGIIFFLALYDRAFPSAALDLTLSRDQIAERAAAYMSQRGHDLAAYETALTFQEAWLPSVYLQQTLGIPGTNKLVQDANLPLWLWEMRWFRPLAKEEWRLSLMPDGTVVAMSHTLLEDTPGADLAQAQARVRAEDYLARDRGWDLAAWEMVTSSSETQAGGRIDHHFEWRQRDWSVGDSELHLAVNVHGDQVDGYGYWLQVPEAFERRFAEQQNRAGFYSNLAFYLGMGGFGLVIGVYFFLGHRRGIFPWYEGLHAGLVVAAVYLLYALNMLPLSKAYYGTTQDYPLFWINRLIDTAITTILVAAAVTVLWGGGRYLGRKVWTGQDPLLPRGEDRWIALAGATWRGLMVAGVRCGYGVAFYLLVTSVLGGWSPMDHPNMNLYATPLPFSAGLVSGIIPAVTEEFVVRLAGIGFLLLVTGRRWLAILLPGVLWAFAHLSYVRDPIYLRGVELTVVAIFYGVIFLRYGLVTTMVAHLTYNASLTALPLLRSGQPSLVINGALIVALLLAPTLPGTVRWLRGRMGKTKERVIPTIGPANEADVEKLARLLPDEAWSRQIADPYTCVLGLSAGQDLMGAAAGHIQPDGAGQVTCLFVAPGWRRRYWGSRLAGALVDALRSRGAHSIQATVPAGSWRLVRFWDAQNWSPGETLFSAPQSSGRGRRRDDPRQVAVNRKN